MIFPCEEQRTDANRPAAASEPASPADFACGIFAQANPRQENKPAAKPQVQPTGAWRVVLLNDPVNRMSYVVMVLRRVFGFPEEEARRHMLEVHESGRSILWSGTREQAEAHMFALQQWHLTAVIQADEA